MEMSGVARRVWWVLGAAAFCGAAAVALLTRDGPVPVRFRTRPGDAALQMYGAADAAPLDGWEAQRLPAGLLRIRRRPAFVAALLARVGIPRKEHPGYDAVQIGDGGTGGAWSEWVIYGFGVGLLEQAPPRSDVAGRWTADDRSEVWTLEGDGSIRGGGRWGCDGDVVLLLLPGGDPGATEFASESLVLDSDRRGARDSGGVHYRRSD